MREIWALAMKDLRLLVRDKGGLFFTFFFPVIYAVFFGYIFASMSSGGGSGTRIIVIDEDRTEGSQAFVEALRAESQFIVTPMDDRAEAQEIVRKGDQTAFIVIPEGFGGASIFQGEPMELILGVDPSKSAEAGLIQGLVTAKAYERLQEMFFDPDTARGMAQDSIASIDDSDLDPAQKLIFRTFLNSLDTFLEQAPEAGVFGDDGDSADGGGEEGPAFNPVAIESVELVGDEGPNPYAIAFPQGIIWGIMGCAAGFGISLVTERNAGTLTRLRTAPLGRGRVLLGKGLACFLTTVSVATSLLLLLTLVFGVTPSSVPLLVVAVLSIAVCFVGLMMLLSTLGKTEASAGGVGWAVMIVMAMLGGGMMPLAFMRGWMVTLSHLSPVKWSILAMEGAIWRGFGPSDMLLPCGVLWAVGILGFALGSKMFAWTEH